MSPVLSAVAAVCDRRPRSSTVIDRRYRVCGLLLALGLLFAFPLNAAETSEPAPLAAKSLLLALARAGDRFVAVGDRGHVVVSDDNGRTWTQRLTPTRAMLTGVSFPDAQHGWAVGHDGIILATTDGGQTWVRQDSGADWETVYLDVLFLDAQHGFAVGAYGKFLMTADGGKTWQAAKPADEEVHYNCINSDPNGHLYLAGESGTLLISDDLGKTWHKSDVPYDGSLFAVVPTDTPTLIVAGLRGHILTSPDGGTNWVSHPGTIPVLIMGGAKLPNGTIVLAGLGGNFFISRDHGSSFTPWKSADFATGVADLVEAADGALVVVGEAGATRVKLP